MKKAFTLTTWTTGIAIFSMFFGAGNVIFPIMLGQEVGDQLFFALSGFLLTAIGGPLLGLFAAVLFEGDSKAFYCRIGKIPGYLLVLLLLFLIGPFAAMPRCVTVSYAAMHNYFPDMSLAVFSIISGMVMLACIIKRDLVLDILGYFLSPVLLISLFVIIFKGFFGEHAPLLPSAYSNSQAFGYGLQVGYSTMDILASIFFSAAVWHLLSESLNIKTDEDKREFLVPTCLWASAIGGFSLGVIYLGLSFVAGINANSLVGVEQEEMLSKLVIFVLGDDLAVIANVAIALACLTTVISLAVTIADVIHNELDDYLAQHNLKFNYYITIFLIVLITVIFSNLGFDGLMSFIVPIISVCYPAIIVLTICNVLYKLFNFPYVKEPFYVTLAVALLTSYYN